jgi:hypothetical protein
VPRGVDLEGYDRAEGGSTDQRENRPSVGPGCGTERKHPRRLTAEDSEEQVLGSRSGTLGPTKDLGSSGAPRSFERSAVS